MPEFDFRKKGGEGSFVWTANDFDPFIAHNEFPYIQMIEYEQDFSTLLGNLNFWRRKIDDPKDAYRGLYLGSPTGNVYYLPFFMESHHQIGQLWQENRAPLGPAMAAVQNAVENVAKAYFPSAGIVYPRSYAGSNEYAYDVRFHLLNTIKEEGMASNKFFLETLIQQNLHVQHNVLTITPPCLYEVYIPGIRWSPVAVVSNLTITNKGVLNRLPEAGYTNYIVPDAWEVHMQIRELINESRDIYLDAIQGAEGIGPTIGPLQPGQGRGMRVRVIDSVEGAADIAAEANIQAASREVGNEVVPQADFDLL